MQVNTSLCESEDSLLLIIDIQEKLFQIMPEDCQSNLQASSQLLLKASELLHIPTIISEQYPKGLGTTIEVIKNASAQDNLIQLEKTCFSCGNIIAESLEKLQRKQIIILGIETHICVLQTALYWLRQNKEVFIVEDATCSRKIENKNNGLKRMQQAGAIITNSESVLFEWLKDAKHEHFKTLSKLLKN